MDPEPPPDPDPYSTYSFKPENNRPANTRPPLRALLWAVMSLACLGLDAFLLLMLSWVLADAFKGHTSSVMLPLLLLTAVVLLLTWFSLRRCFRSD
jgi:hypothetical protein